MLFYFAAKTDARERFSGQQGYRLHEMASYNITIVGWMYAVSS
jgi:hypothetical protein